MTDLTLKENEQWLNGYKAGYAQAQETDLSQPAKEWVGLTEEDIAKNIYVEGEFMLPYSFASSIEAMLKDKNGY